MPNRKPNSKFALNGAIVVAIATTSVLNAEENPFAMKEYKPASDTSAKLLA